MSFRRSLRRWRYRHSESALGLPVRAVRRSDDIVGPVTAITPPAPTRTASDRTGARVGLRLSVTAFVVVSLFSVLLVRLWSLQLVQGAQLNSVARAYTTATVEVPAPRGQILTRDGVCLACDEAFNEIVLAQGEEKQHPEVIARLAHLLGLSVKSIDTQLASERYANAAPVPLPVSPTQVTAQDVLYIKQYPQTFPGVTVTVGYQRTYPQHALASQVLGYLGAIPNSTPLEQQQLKALEAKGYSIDDIIGESGLEAQYESALRGKPGVDTFEVDASGNSIGAPTETTPVAGDQVVLNMDAALERTLTDDLNRQVGKLGSPWGAAVVLNVNNGAVLAMTSAPGYDNNVWGSVVGVNGVPGISTAEYNRLNPPGCASGNPNVSCPLLDYAVSGLQPPGSTFKLATATAAMNVGLINANSYYDDTGSFTIGNPPTTFHDSDNEALGEVNVTSALSESSDVFFYNLGAEFWVDRARYGQTPIQKTASAYGLGAASGIDLPGTSVGQLESPALLIQQHHEAPAAFPNPTYFEGYNIELAFGQGETLVTPLQLAEAYSTFANGGTRYAPELAAAIVSPHGQLVKRIAPKVMSRVDLPPSTRQPMLDGFRGAVQNARGTAYAAFSGFDFSKWDVAGKTGTATTCAGDVSCQPTSWFVAFMGPQGGKPQYAVAVEIDQGGFGAAASAPVARQVLSYLAQHPLPPVSLPSGS
ncbi:MAG TPA: penicillin-binding transpeptidase domain-containing protein [Acidimicrobiales bacterium]|nr:penicillin-binding transpeptidase domain-containing protein [Acidimicrobiales bacterium]